jgi:hypothetical protein
MLISAMADKKTDDDHCFIIECCFDGTIQNRHQMLELVRATDVGTLSQPDRFKLIKSLQGAIVLLARNNGDYVKKEQCTFVDERKYAEEVALLVKLQRSLRYSYKLQSFFVHASVNLLSDQRDIIDRTLRWEQIPFEERTDLTRQIIHAYINHIHQELGWQSPDFQVAFKDLPQGGIGRVNFKTIPVSLEISNDAVTSCNDCKQFMRIAGHEIAHLQTYFLALAARDGIMPSDHILYADATMRLDQIVHGAITHSIIKSSYAACHEEGIAGNVGEVLDIAVHNAQHRRKSELAAAQATRLDEYRPSNI